MPIVRTLDDVARLDGQRVRILGQYRRADVRMARFGSPVYRGHVIVALEDERPVALLPVWQDNARRPLDEVQRLHGQTVAVVGTIWAAAPEDPAGGASPIGPCVDDVEALGAQ